MSDRLVIGVTMGLLEDIGQGIVNFATNLFGAASKVSPVTPRMPSASGIMSPKPTNDELAAAATAAGIVMLPIAGASLSALKSGAPAVSQSMGYASGGASSAIQNTIGSIARIAVPSVISAGSFGAALVASERATWDAYDAAAGSDGGSSSPTEIDQQIKAANLEQTQLENQALKDKLNPVNDIDPIAQQTQFENLKQEYLDTQLKALQLQNASSPSSTSALDLQLKQIELQTAQAKLAQLMNPVDSGVDPAHAELYNAQAYYYGMLGSQLEQEIADQKLKDTLSLAGGGGGEAVMFDPYAAQPTKTNKSTVSASDMSFPYRGRSNYRRSSGGQGRVRVGQRYVYSSTPRAGFRPAQGGGYYRRRYY